MRFCYQCEKPGQKGAAGPCGARGGGRVPWCRGEFQGELPGRCCQLAQWAAGFSSDERISSPAKTGAGEGCAAKAGIRLGAEVLLGCQVHRNPMGPEGQDPYIAWVERPGLQVHPIARLQFLVWTLHDEAGGPLPCPALLHLFP